MRFFLDSCDLDEIQDALERGFARGFTTNPIHLRAQVASDPISHLSKIVGLVEREDCSLPISVQVMTADPAEMPRQARQLVEALSYKHLAIKVPISWDNLGVVKHLASDGITVNCTACMSISQALLAASAGARYVSMFFGKMSDAGVDAVAAFATVAPLLEKYNSELIVGSIRRTYDLQEVASSGAHIATVPGSFLRRAAEHEKTDEAVLQFAENFMPLDRANR